MICYLEILKYIVDLSDTIAKTKIDITKYGLQIYLE